MDSYARFTKSFSVNVTPESLKELDRLRRKSRQSRSELVRVLIEEALAARAAATPPVR